MKPSRRQFIRVVAASGAASVLSWKTLKAFYETSRKAIPLFGTSLRSVGPGGIPVAAPDALPAPVTGVAHYTMDIRNFSDPGLCPTLGPTELWGYHPAVPLGGGVQPQRHLGGILVAHSGVPVQITFRNNLNVQQHLLPNDLSIAGADLGVDRVAVHLHGGLTPWISDGGPHSWFDPRGGQGASFLNNAILNPDAALNEAEYYYPNNQSARILWYHDHALGITRLNAYAGLASAYILRDTFEIGLKALGLPEFVENSVLSGNTVQELPLVVQDKVFVGPDILRKDPEWLGSTEPGALWYAHQYEPDRWDLDTEAGELPPVPSCVPEFFGDTMLVNGTAYPKATVEGRRYRLRILNACNARFLNLQLYVADRTPNGMTVNPVTGVPINSPFVDGAQLKPAVLQIANDGGLLPRPVQVPTNVPFDQRTLGGSLILAPAERADVLIDFSRHVGESLILYSDAPAPFPNGDELYDFFPDLKIGINPMNRRAVPGYGPNTRVLMRFDVVAATGTDLPLAIDTNLSFLSGIDTLLVPPGVTTVPPGVPVRTLTLNETVDQFGRLTQMLGTGLQQPGGGYSQPYEAEATEVPLAGTTEVWEIYNLSEDVHPMHFHLVNVQIINRQAFDSFDGVANFTGPVVAPEPNETGWKETVRMYPSTVTRVIMKFDLPEIRTSTGALIPIPASPRTGGAEYVWHCHILEHEEHDMMRPVVVL